MELDYNCSKAVEEAKEHLVDWLREAEGEHYISDIGMECTEDENRQGYWIPGTNKAIETALGNWGLSEYTVAYGKDELDSDWGKTFWENPEAFWCICMITLCERLWNQAVSDLELDKDGDEIVVNEELADKVEKALEKYKSIRQLGMEV